MASETENKQDTYNNCFVSQFPGSLRDWYAGQALVGLLTTGASGQIHNQKEGVPLAYKWADAMIAEGNRKEEPNDD